VRALLPLLLGAVLIGCSRPPGSEEAEATFAAFREALLGEDYGAVYDLRCADDRSRMEAALREIHARIDRMDEDETVRREETLRAERMGVSVETIRGATPREYFVLSSRQSERDTGRLGRLAKTSLDEPPRIRGGECLLVLREEGGQRIKMWLVVEDGAWKLRLRGGGR
jgi:hypothetical protein